jgi:hypothetical protein
MLPPSMTAARGAGEGGSFFRGGRPPLFFPRFLAIFPSAGGARLGFWGEPPPKITALPYCRSVGVDYIHWFSWRVSQASVAQSAEQLICNQQVVGSSPSASSYRMRSAVICQSPARRRPATWIAVLGAPALGAPAYRTSGRTEPCGAGWSRATPLGKRKDVDSRAGGFPERSKGSDCKSDGYAFAGSNPAPPTETNCDE